MTNSIHTRKTRSGETLTVGLAEEMGIDAESRWITFCEDHEAFVESETKNLAYQVTGADFCDECREAASQPKQAKSTVNFRVRTQANAYSEGAMDAYDMLVTMLEEKGINGLLEGIEWNARPETVKRLNSYYSKN